MTSPNYEQAKAYAVRRLSRDLLPNLFYHSIAHTCDDVVPAVLRLAEGEGVVGEDLALLLTAAYFHDVGFVETLRGHEEVGIRIAQSVLPGLGFSAAQLDIICGIILATRIPQTPRTLLEAIIADADLDILGRDDFWDLNHKLRAEWAAHGVHSTDEAWFAGQVAFLSGHTYFTATARRLRETGQARYLGELREQLAHAQTAKP
jgi:uncharacterized protein